MKIYFDFAKLFVKQYVEVIKDGSMTTIQHDKKVQNFIDETELILKKLIYKIKRDSEIKEALLKIKQKEFDF